MKYSPFLLLLLALLGCSTLKKGATVDKTPFNATVGKIGGDCGNSHLLHLKGPDEMAQLSLPVYEINLPDSLKIEGQKLYIEYRAPTDDEMMVCFALGPGYHQVFITAAKRAE